MLILCCSQIHFFPNSLMRGLILLLTKQLIKYEIVCLKWVYAVLDQDILMTGSANSC